MLCKLHIHMYVYIYICFKLLWIEQGLGVFKTDFMSQPLNAGGNSTPCLSSESVAKCWNSIKAPSSDPLAL